MSRSDNLSEKMKVATFNVNSIRSRLHIVIPWLKENKIDILCMQETKVDNRNFPESYFSRIRYLAYFNGSKGRNGVAIATKYEPDEIKIGLNGKDLDRVISARFGDVKIVNVYVPQGYRIDSEKYKYKLDFLKRLRDYLRDSRKTIVCGDMNVAPDDIDVHSPDKLRNHVCFHIDVRKAYKEILKLGFVDLLRKFHPNERIYTFYDYRVKDAVRKGIGWRVDAILATKDIEDKCTACYVDLKLRLMERPSDHVPIIAEFGGDLFEAV